MKNYTLLTAITFFLFLFACQEQEEDQNTEKVQKVFEYKIPDPDSSLMRFESTIRDYEKDDSLSMPAQGGVVFVGSSSFRRWSSLEEDMAPIPALNRGFGGSTFPELLYYAHRVVAPYRPSLIAVYEGDNDLVDSTMSPEMVLENLQRFEAFVESQLPDAHILMFAVKPSPKRRNLIDKAIEANKLLAEYAAGSDRITFVDIFQIMLDDNGKILGDIFTDDSLHMNEEGYELWTEVSKPIIDSLYNKGH